MLVDVTIKPKPSAPMLTEEEIDTVWMYARHSKGVFLFGHWSPTVVIKEKILSEYPEFSRDGICFVERLLKQKSDDRYLLDQYATLQRCPEDSHRLYRFENWRKDEFNDVRTLNAYGVCDGPEQLLSLYNFEADPRRLFISMVPLRKKDQSPGGWRWHKWGPYVGKQDPQCEYLMNEPVIEEVYTYHVYELE